MDFSACCSIEKLYPKNYFKNSLLLIISIFFTIGINAQWLDFQDETDTRLVLSSVANSDGEEKDFSTADLNNDGLMDVIVVRKEPFSIQTDAAKSDLLLMNVNGILTDQTATFAPEFLTNVSFARDVVIDDFDGDGWKDVVIANTFGQQPIYYKNLGEDGSGNWLGLVDETSTRFPTLNDDVPLICAVWSGDLDGDSDMDLYFVNYKVNSAGGTAKDFLLMNDGSGVFTDESQTRLGDLRNSAFGTAVQIVDFDNDGDNDILKISTLYSVAPWGDSGLFVLFNDGTGNFSNWVNIAPYSPYMFEVYDYNDDGMLDCFVVDDGSDYVLLTTAITPDVSVTVTKNNVISGVGGFGGNVHKGDLDLDGDMDIIVSDVDVDIPPCNSGRKIAILQNNNGLFTDVYNGGTYDWADNSYDLSILDINSDGLLDFITGGCDGYGVFMSDNCDLITGQADLDGDGLADACDPCPNNPDLNCTEPIDYPTVSTDYTIARQWNEMLLESIRLDFARPTSHARNLYHHSAAMYDVWATYDSQACNYLLGKTVDGFSCAFSGVPTPPDTDAAIAEAISFMSYKLLKHRFQNSPNAIDLMQAYDVHMTDSLGYDITNVSMDYSTGSAAALGNYIGQCYIDFGLQDGSNEQNDYANQFYLPVNDPLVVDQPGNPDLTDFNRWQPLTLELFIDQSGNEIPGSTPEFLSPEWGQVSNFSLKPEDLDVYQRDGNDYNVYHDPGTPPQHAMDNSGDSPDYLWGYETVILWSSHLDATDNVTIDISPAALGNRVLPTSVSDYPNFYDQLNGGTQSNGHSINPATGAPYPSNVVPRADYARVLAEFWADGPESETPPGHWFTIVNYVDDHPDLVKQYKGQGAILSDLEWEIKAYFTMGGAMHDCAVTAWGNKGWYDYIRPISAIRGMADLGQRTDAGASNYHPAGIALIPGKIETVETGDPLAGLGDVNVGKIKVMAWQGHDAINNVDTDEAGVDWILAENWVPYQRPSFVTPPFAGYVSGHSTFSRAAAEVLTEFTGDPYFPGGVGEFVAQQDEFLVFEDGPSQDIILQWATYRDAADESGLSRIWGGIHPPADDIPGRFMGEEIGLDAFALAEAYFTQPGDCTDPLACNYNSLALCDDGSCILPDGCTDSAACNYDSNALCDDDSCILPDGCTDSTACNYDSNALCDDGSCDLPDGCTDNLACNYNAGASCDDGSCEYLSCAGCTDATACNYDLTATIDDGSCVDSGCTDTNACNFNPLAGCDNGSCEYSSCPGCTDSNACNYQPGATIDDGTCTYPGCIDSGACNFNASAGCDDLSCEYLSCAGCTDSNACNYDSTATIENGSCTFPGCTNSTACNYDSSAGCDDGSCEFITCSGCTDNNACNYESTATIDDGSCTFPGCNDNTACNYNSNAGCDDGSCTYPGCNDNTACNYSSLAGCDDGSCTFPGCNDSNACNFDSTAGCDDGSCTYPGCTDSAACNYDSLAGCDDGTCTFPGCTDESACNFDIQAGCDNGTCIPSGCMDNAACNYNSLAQCDSGDCSYPGCNDPAATNYDSTAGCDDGSCIFPICTDVTLTIDTDCYANEISWILTYQDGTVIDQISTNTLTNASNNVWNYCLDNGCYTFTINDTFGDGLNGSADAGCTIDGNYVFEEDGVGVIFQMGNPDYDFGITHNFCVSSDGGGCTNPVACNFNAAATFDDGSCLLPGCTDNTACNYDSTAACDDGSCIAGGCLDNTACNYDSTAACDNGTCIYGPVNDVCANAIALGAGFTTIDNTNACVTEGYTVPGGGCNGTTTWCNQNAVEVDVFYSFTTPSSPAEVRIETFYDGTGTQTDTQLAVFSECGGTLIAANDDSGQGWMSQLDFGCNDLLPNTTYIILIDGYNGMTGTALMEIEFNSANCGAEGCMDSTACNYDVGATTDDGSCTYPGCMDVSACNYNSIAACEDGSCEYASCIGCTDATACNFDSLATIDNGSCVYPGCDDSTACNYDSTAACNDGSCDYTSCVGCTDSTACNFDSNATVDDGSCATLDECGVCDGTGTSGCNDINACNYDSTADCDDGSCEYISCLGCDDAAACNYDSTATINDGSCTYPGCTDPGACNFLFEAGCDDGSCNYTTCAGCTDITACNFDFIATLDDGSCVYPGCMDVAACNYDSTVGCNDGSCTYPGCNDVSACNYDSNAGCDDGSCTYALWYLPNAIGDGPIVLACNAPADYFLADQGCAQTVVDNDPYCVDTNWDNICSRAYNCCLGNFGCFDGNACNFDPTLCPDNALCVYPGCTDSNACNFDSLAGCEDGSCTYPGCNDAGACNFDSLAGCDDGSCTYPGCNDAGACNFDSLAGCDDGSCTYPGCNDAGACNYDSLAGCDDGSCTYPGCDDAGACNFDSLAGCDDGSCTYPGCNDAGACNYDSLAGCDDGSCTYPGCNDAGACNFDSLAGCDDGSCTYPGCNDAGACNFDSLAGCDDGSCTYPGCTDLQACNYDSTAGCDDGSCDIPNGCTDSNACNYDSSATCDDGTCTYAPCGTCVGDANADGYVNILDLVSVSSNFGCTFGCLGNGDSNFDGIVNIIDLISVSSNFGNICD